MKSKITENDIRIIRRLLVALNFEENKAAERIEHYLRSLRKLNLVLPDEQTKLQLKKYFVRLQQKEKWLAEKFGCVLMPDYGEAIFLNSMWADPFTLYVRLVKRVTALAELGEINWLPENRDGSYKDIAEKNHAAYLKAKGVNHG